MKSQNADIAADQTVIEEVGGKLLRWIDEVSMLHDIRRNAERTGMAPEPTNIERARKLAQEMDGWRSELSAGPASTDVKASCEWRILEVAVDAIHTEVEAVRPKN